MAQSISGSPPDGGWGWMIVFGSFLVQMVTIGITYTFGVMYIDFLEYFGESESATAWIGSIQPALLYFVGVLAGPLLKHCGWRMMTVCGAVLSASGLFFSCLATNIYVLYVTYGAMTGAGFGLMYLTSMVIIQHYFERRRAMATGLAVSGSGVGTICFGFLSPFLLKHLQWRMTVVVEGAIVLFIGLVGGILFRPLTHETPKDDEHKRLLNKEPEDTTRYGHSPTDSQDTGSSSNGRSSPLPIFTDNDDSPNNSFPQGADYGNEWRASPVRRLVKDISPTSALHQPPEVKVKAAGPCVPCCGSCFPCCAARSEPESSPGGGSALALCRHPVLVLYCLTILLFCLGYHVPYAFTPDRATKVYHISTEHASMLVAVMGMANVTSRLVLGWVGDHSARLRFIVMGTVITLCGLLNMCIYLFTTFRLLLLYSVLFGSLTGCFASLFAVVLVDLLGVEVIEYTLGQCLASSAAAFLFASPLSGCIIQRTGSYNAPFMVAGGFQVLGGVVFFSIALVRRYCVQNDGGIPQEETKPGTYRSQRRLSPYLSESIA